MHLGANNSSTQLLLDSVQLYKALGGGWQVFEPVADTANTANHTAVPPAAAGVARPLS